MYAVIRYDLSPSGCMVRRPRVCCVTSSDVEAECALDAYTEAVLRKVEIEVGAPFPTTSPMNMDADQWADYSMHHWPGGSVVGDCPDGPGADADYTKYSVIFPDGTQTVFYIDTLANVSVECVPAADLASYVVLKMCFGAQGLLIKPPRLIACTNTESVASDLLCRAAELILLKNVSEGGSAAGAAATAGAGAPDEEGEARRLSILSPGSSGVQAATGTLVQPMPLCDHGFDNGINDGIIGDVGELIRIIPAAISEGAAARNTEVYYTSATPFIATALTVETDKTREYESAYAEVPDMVMPKPGQHLPLNIAASGAQPFPPRD